MENNEEQYVGDMPETTAAEIIAKIRALAWKIRDDGGDPRFEVNDISGLCDKLDKMLKGEGEK